MWKRWSLKRDDRGAALIAVVIILMVVGIIGTVVTEVTITNVEMKGMESAGKTNFYSAEVVVDDFASGLNDLAAVDMRDAYTEILSDYRNSMGTGHDIQKEFARRYLNKLLKRFQDSTYTAIQKLPDGSVGDAVMYQVGRYDIATVKGALVVKNPDGSLDAEATAALQSYWRDPSVADYHVDYDKGTFTLMNLCIDFQNTDNPYRTVIHTNIVFHTPELNFRGSNVMKEFMRYSLIAQDGIRVGARNVSVAGSAYAGTGGIFTEGSADGSFTGGSIVTRGDIVAKNGGTLVVGSNFSRVWAENVETQGTGSPAVIELNGSCYIADDLTMNGENGEVRVKGSYYGYNFQKDYTALAPTKDSSYSSAIMINGRNNHLILQDAQYLLLSGKTFIARSSSVAGGQNDVPLGESVSVRSNQMAYYVPSYFLVDDGTNPVTFRPESGAADCSAYLGVDNIESYLNPAKPVETYNYLSGGSIVKCYYLNFADDQKANDFFGAYMANAANRAALGGYASAYAADDALVLGDGTVYSLRGNLMYREKSDDPSVVNPLQERTISLSGGWGKNEFYWNYADNLARTYKSLQMYLEEPYAIPSAKKVNVEGKNVRFLSSTDENIINKEEGSLLDNIMKWGDFQTRYASSEYVDTSNAARILALKNGNFTVDPGYSGGIVIATGNVTVSSSFSGMIIAGGEINFTDNVTLTANEMTVSQMFSEDMARTTPLFADLFEDYANLSESVIGQVQVDKYLTYDQWTKTQE